MGRPKALLPVRPGGETFVEYVVNTFRTAGIAEIVVVLGADADAIRRRVPGRTGVRVVDNPDYDLGQLSSLLTGLRAIDRVQARGALVTLVDVPLVTARTVQTLLHAYGERQAPIVRPVSRGRHGHPVIFDRALFDELERADPSTGAKPVVNAHAKELLEVPVDDEGAFADIDTREDYERLIGPLG
jgi:molybdenum cofactor cytidylyltransferase